MAKPFRILRLPPDALKKACILMDSMDLIELSFCSAKAKSALKSLLIRPKSYSVKYTNDEKSIKFELLNGEQIVWKFESNHNINEILERRTFGYREGAFVFKMSIKTRKSASGIAIYPSRSWSEEFLMLFFFSHFLEVFHSEISSLQLEIFEVSPKNYFLAQCSIKRLLCETLDLIGIPDIPVISNALDNITAQNQISISPPLPMRYPFPQVRSFGDIMNRILPLQKRERFQKELQKELIDENKALFNFEQFWKVGSKHIIKNLTVPQLIIANGNWVTLENLKRINSRYCRIKGSMFSLQNIHHYIQSFLDFDTGLNVEWLTVDVIWTEWERRDLMKVFKTRKWNPDERDGYFSQFQGDTLQDIDCREGLDIERVDGILATGVLENVENATLKFHFIVWKTRFPNVENVVRGREMLAKMEKRDWINQRKINDIGMKQCENFRKIESLRAEIEHMKKETKQELGVNMKELDDYALDVIRLTETLNNL